MQCILTFSIQGFFYFLSKIADSNLEMKNHQKAKLFFTYVHMKYIKNRWKKSKIIIIYKYVQPLSKKQSKK